MPCTQSNRSLTLERPKRLEYEVIQRLVLALCDVAVLVLREFVGTRVEFALESFLHQVLEPLVVHFSDLRFDWNFVLV